MILLPRNPTEGNLDLFPLEGRCPMERGGWIYLFIALDSDAKSSERPQILAIQESQLGEQQLILSPNYQPETNIQK